MKEQGDSVEQRIENCLNCTYDVSVDAQFCLVCGQKTKESKLTISHFLGDFLSNIFNLDSKIFRTIPALFVPAKLTTEYISGKRKKYLNPGRLFLVTVIIHFALLNNLLINTSENNLGEGSIYEDAYKAKLVSNYDSISYNILQSDSSLIDSLRLRLFDISKRGFKDSLDLNVTGLSVNIDNNPQNEIETLKSNNNSFEKKIRISKVDLVQMSTKDIISAYNIDNKLHKLMLTQFIAIRKNPKGVISFIIGNLLWVEVLVILCLSAFFKILYWRSKRYYVEHLIYFLHLHSFCFLLIAVLLAIGLYLPSNENEELIEILLTIAPIGVFLFSFAAQKTYYGQGWIKTFGKFLLTNLVHFILLLVFVILISLLSVVIF